jgi:hypothetical protein
MCLTYFKCMLLIKHKNGVVPHSSIRPASGLDDSRGGVTT